jgi:hypothetical protein
LNIGSGKTKWDKFRAKMRNSKEHLVVFIAWIVKEVKIFPSEVFALTNFTILLAKTLYLLSNGSFPAGP